MRTVSVRLADLEKAIIPIGFVGENLHTQVRIDCKKAYDEYPNAAASIAVCSPTGEKYPAVVVRDGDIVVWDITNSDLIHKGFGEFQLSFTVDEIVAKSFKGRIKVLDSIVSTGDIPDPLDDFITRAGAALTAIPETIDAALQEAKDSGEFDGVGIVSIEKTATQGLVDTYTITLTNGETVEYNVANGEKGDPGEDGVSPVANVSKVGSIATISITDKAGTTTATIADGVDGTSPVANVSKSGSTATISITDKTGTTTATVADGIDGVSPTASVSKTGNTATISITDKSGTTTTQITDGATGATPNFSIGTVTTGEAGSDADATITGTAENPVLNLTIPRGDTGEVSEAELQTKANAIVNSASGSIASFSDGADGQPVRDCVVQIEPVQDLHGQANPYPAGGGKNKFQTTATTNTVSDVTFTVNPDGSVRVSGVPSAGVSSYIFGEVTLPAGTYRANGFASGASNAIRMAVLNNSTSAVLALIYNGRDIEFTLESETTVKVYPIVPSSYDGTAVTFYPMIRLSTVTDSTFAPYENICPITGWTGANITRTGRNLFYGDTSGYMSNIDGSISSAGSDIKAMSVYVPCGDNTKLYYYIEAHTDTQNNYAYRISFYDSDKKWITNTGMNVFGTTTAVNIPNNTEYIRCSSWETGGRLSIAFENYETYIPYNGTTYPVTWQTEAGTVYGGTLDVTTGELVVDRASYTWSSGGNLTSTNAFAITKNDVIKIDASNQTTLKGAICDKFPSATWASISTKANVSQAGCAWNNALAFRIAGYTTAEEYTSFLENNPLQFVYLLNTPITYQLTPTEITSLLGQNHLFADCGSISVDYRADTKSYVDGVIPAVPVQDVQVNGTSVLSNGVANVPVSASGVLGVVKPGGLGVRVNAYGELVIESSSDANVKAGTSAYNAITPSNQHKSTFYGLATASGDTTQSASSNAVGVYTEGAKSSIAQMLDAPETVSGSTPSITAKAGVRYVCGEVSTLSVTAPASGCIDVTFTSGSTATVLTVTTAKSGATLKWANGFDPTSLEANTTYEINILDGEYGVVGSWT